MTEGVGRGAIFRATSLVMLAACCFGSISVLALLGQQRGTSLITLLIGRYVVAIVALLLLLRFRLPQTTTRRALALATLFGGAQAAVAFFSLQALQHIPAAIMSFLFYTFPAMVAGMAALSRTERLTPRRVIALGVSLAGITVMVGAPWKLAASGTGVGLALTAALAYALYVLGLSRWRDSLDPYAATFYISIGALTTFLILGLATDQITWRPDVPALLVMVVLGSLSTVVAFFAFMRGLVVLGAVRTSIISTVEPFWTAFLAFLVLGQGVAAGTVLGGALIAAAVILLQLGPGRR